MIYLKADEGLAYSEVMKVMDLVPRGGRAKRSPSSPTRKVAGLAMANANGRPQAAGQGPPPPVDRPLARGHPAGARRGDVRHQHHAPHRRDAGAAHHLHGGDAAGPEGARHRAAPAAPAEHAATAAATPTRWCSASRIRAARHHRQQEARSRPARSSSSGSRTSSRPAPTRRSSCGPRARSPTARSSRRWTSPEGAGVERIGIISEKMIEEAGGAVAGQQARTVGGPARAASCRRAPGAAGALSLVQANPRRCQRLPTQRARCGSLRRIR